MRCKTRAVALGAVFIPPSSARSWRNDAPVNPPPLRAAERTGQASSIDPLVARDIAPAALLAGGLLVAFVGRDLSWVTAERPAGYERLIHLFVYNYDRPWPEHFDYRAILTGFTVVASLLVMGAAIRALRPVLTLSLVGVATLFSLWCLDVYMIDLSPHWGQRELIDRYYAQRKGPKIRSSPGR